MTLRPMTDKEAVLKRLDDLRENIHVRNIWADEISDLCREAASLIRGKPTTIMDQIVRRYRALRRRLLVRERAQRLLSGAGTGITAAGTRHAADQIADLALDLVEHDLSLPATPHHVEALPPIPLSELVDRVRKADEARRGKSRKWKRSF